ncbi:MAG: hypothetical protein MI864_08820 [Pseudomonadales bacterium]|nr:hypothetical protein [Pseudomonadales bacterium]
MFNIPLRPQHLIFWLSLSLLTACGFQLRGQEPVPQFFRDLNLYCPAQNPFELCQSLKSRIDEKRDQAPSNTMTPLTLHILKTETTRQAVSIKKNASVAEYDMEIQTWFDFKDPDGRTILNDTVSTRQTYRFDEENILGKNKEEAEIKVDLLNEIARRIILRINAINDLALQEKLQPETN